MKIISIIFSGGAVARNWPASRRAHPKPFMALGGGDLLEQVISSRQACGTDQSLCLPYHRQRTEQWVMVRGHGLVQIGDEEHPTQPGQHWYMPLNEKHRLTNTVGTEQVSIEVQCGECPGEDDIVGLADSYGWAG